MMIKAQSELFPPISETGVDDVIIIGGGLAGLFCALKLSPRPVTLLTAAPIGTGASSTWAQAGIAAAVGPGDTVEKHLQDTVSAGDGIVDRKIAQLMVAEAADRVHDLLEFGVPFDRDLEGRLQTSREAAHGESRIVRVSGDRAGAAIMQALVSAVRATPTIRLYENHLAEELLTDGKKVIGVLARPDGGTSAQRIEMPARAVVMATGGIGHLFEVTTNPPQANGDGCGMAARAGAVIADPEFVQFHPTAIRVDRDPAPLATEALRGEGCTLHNDSGTRFMLDIDPAGELAPRDVVARGIDREVKAGRGAWLDCREAVGTHFAERFPTVLGYCRDAGIDPAAEPIPVIPAAHYHMGGILTDAEGRSSLDGLWACGEVASTGAHGANRLASNSLLEAVVFAARIAEDIRDFLPRARTNAVKCRVVQGETGGSGADGAKMARLRKLMTARLGVIRNGAGIREALDEIRDMEKAGTSARMTNVLTTAKLVAVAALRREESRGAHYRSDFEVTDPAWRRRTYLTLREAERFVALTPA